VQIIFLWLMASARRLESGMETSAKDWLEIGRLIARDPRFTDHDAQAKQKFLASQASALAREKRTPKVLSTHTLHRFASAASFVDRELESDTGWGAFPVASLEVIMRVNKVNPAVARGMLTDLKSGELTFRAALTREGKLREQISNDQREIESKPKEADERKLRAVVRSALQLSKQDELFQIEPREDWRYPLIRSSHQVFLAPRVQSACIFSESILPASINYRRPLLEMIGQALAACSLFKLVIVRLFSDEGLDLSLKYFRKAESRPSNIILLVGPRLVATEIGD
jgi:hypothetical protein